MTRQGQELHQTDLWGRPAELMLYGLLATAIMLGGAPNDANWQISLICASAAVLLPVSIAAGAGQTFASLSPLTKIVAVTLIALPVAQLIPMPPQVWQALLGYSLPNEVFTLLGTSEDWRGISLVPRETLFGFAMVLPAAAAFLASLTLSRGGRKRVIWTLLGLIAISLLFGLVQFGSRGASLDLYGTAHRGSLLGFFANRNHQGLLMAIGGCFAITTIKIRIQSPRIAIATALLVSLVFLTAAVGTLSRAGIGLTFLGLSSAFYAGFIHGKLRWPIIVGGGLAAVSVLYFLTFSSTVQSALDRFSRIEENGRQEIWQKTWPLIEQYFPWGAGLGSFTHVYPAIEKLEDVSPFYFNRVHNEYLELLIEFGVPGVAILMLFFLLFGKRAASGLRDRSELGAFAFPAAASIILVGLHSMVDYPLRTQSHAVIFALACGLLFAQNRVRNTKRVGASDSANWHDRSTRLKALSLAGQTVALAAFVLLASYQKGVADRMESSGSELVNTSGQAMDPARLAEAKRMVARQPLDQPLLNVIYASEVRNGMDETRRRQYISALRKMGWRDTPTQQNLLFEAARSNELESALDHMDALLRRGKLAEQIMPLLAQLEIEPAGTRLMAERLAQYPVWRRDYFDFASPLSNPEVLNARLRLFQYMEANNMAVGRIEKRVTLFALLRADRRQEIVNLGRSQLGADKRDQLVFDSEFDQLLHVPAQERLLTTPLDWRLTNQSGISSQIIAEEWGSRLVVRWNGRGAPIIARTLTFLTEGQQPELEVSLSAGSDVRGLDSLRFTLICSGEREVLFVRRSAVATSLGVDRRSAYYRAEYGAPCDFPELYIGGRPRVEDRSADLSIDSIKLTLP